MAGKKQIYRPLCRKKWLEKYGAALPPGCIVLPCAPVLGCKEQICKGWRVVIRGK